MESGGGECIYPFDTFYCNPQNPRKLRKKASSLGNIISLKKFFNHNNTIFYKSYNARILSFITIIDLKWVLFKNDARCRSNATNAPVYGGRFHDVENCAIACKDNSSMFSYCRSCCDTNGCECFCEISALSDGTCQVIEGRGYTLYKYLKGKVLEFSMVYMRHNKKFES